MKPYRRIHRSDRDKIEALYNAGLPVKTIAAELGFSQVSIYAELKRGFYSHRNSDWTETVKYSADKAQRSADYWASSKGASLKIGNDHAFATFVEDMVLAGYSPEAILGYIKRHNLQFKTKVCRVTLYNYIYNGVLGRISAKNLLRKGKMKRKHKKEPITKQLPKMEHSIEKRPKEVLARLSFGHWELDSVIGTAERGKTLLSLTERKTRMQLVFVAPDKTAVSVVRCLNKIERKVGSFAFRKIFRTITCDNGPEFSDAVGIETSPYTKKRRTTLYYCHPYCASERGSNENQNAFIRRFVPKGIPICEFSDRQIKDAQRFINNYPRRIFDFFSASDLFTAELSALGLPQNHIFL